MLKALASLVRLSALACVVGASAVSIPGVSMARESRVTPLDESQALIAVADLPVQGRKTYALILDGGPFPYDKDGAVFGNRERALPKQKRGYYREYTVKTSGSRDRGARRIVCGGKQPTLPDACFYTSDHYNSFRRIVN